MLLSIVIPVYNEAGNLQLTLRALQTELCKVGCDAEIVFVNIVRVAGCDLSHLLAHGKAKRLVGSAGFSWVPADEVRRRISARASRCWLWGLSAIISGALAARAQHLHGSRVWYRHDPTETTTYLGITALLLIAIALRFLDRRTLVWAVGAVFFLLLAMADFLYWPRLFYYLAPKLNLFARHGNYFLFTTFCLSVLAGFGMDFLWQSGKQPETLAFVQKMRLWGLIVIALGLVFSSAVALAPAPEAQARVFAIVNNQINAAIFFFLTLGLFLLVLTQKLAAPIVQTLILP